MLLGTGKKEGICLKYCAVARDPFLAPKVFFFVKLKQIHEPEQVEKQALDT